MNATANAELGAGRPREETIEVIGFERRLAATIIDGLIVVVASTIVGFVVSLFVVLAMSYDTSNDFPYNYVVTGAGILVSLAYYVGYWARSGQTVGKFFLGIMVVGEDGSIPAPGKALLRYVGYIISGVVLSLGFLWVAFDQKRQGWHDKIAGTYVIYSESEFSDVEAVNLVPAEPNRGWIWLVVWIVLAIGMPGALLASLTLLGPSINRAITNILEGLT